MNDRTSLHAAGTLVLTGLYQFQKPGEYSVRVQQFGEFERGFPVLAEDTASVRVLPFDASRLGARCEELFRPLRTHSSSRTDIPQQVRVAALYSVRSDLVLPYLDWMAREFASRYACRAIRRVGTTRAERLLNALAARRDKVGEAARKAMKMPVENTSPVWEMAY